MQKRKKNYKMKPVTRYSLYGLSALLVLLAVIAYMYVSKGSMDNPVELPESAQRIIRASGGNLSKNPGSTNKRTLSTDFYNGSNWIVTSVDIEVRSLDKEYTKERRENYPDSRAFFDRRTFRFKIRQNDSDDSDETKRMVF